jgi:hypothetical protein
MAPEMKRRTDGGTVAPHNTSFTWTRCRNLYVFNKLFVVKKLICILIYIPKDLSIVFEAFCSIIDV